MNVGVVGYGASATLVNPVPTSINLDRRLLNLDVQAFDIIKKLFKVYSLMIISV